MNVLTAHDREAAKSTLERPPASRQMTDLGRTPMYGACTDHLVKNSLTVIALGVDAAHHWLNRSPPNIAEATRVLSLARAASSKISRAMSGELTKLEEHAGG
ncbi:hypothetical protein [Neoroseomonas lacus]|nr:hypothetical protein [Neoroseomonas lacus]